MSSPTEYDLLLFGHFAKDRNVVDGKGEIESGGAVYYASIALRQMGLRVGIVTRLHHEDFHQLDEIKLADVDVFAQPATETSGIENTYNSADMERRVCKSLGFAGAMQIADIPNVRAQIYAIVPIIAGEFDLAYLKALAVRGPIALDVQGFVRVREGSDLVSRPWKEMARGLAQVMYLKVDRAEAELLTRETDLAKAARKLSAYGPREIVLTQSSGVTVFADGQIHSVPFTPRSLAGRTGRGDTCFMAYLGRRLSASPEEACRFAAAVTTLKQEKPGPWRGSLADVERVMRVMCAIVFLAEAACVLATQLLVQSHWQSPLLNPGRENLRSEIGGEFFSKMKLHINSDVQFVPLLEPDPLSSLRQK